jgi:hypothetical protein
MIRLSGGRGRGGSPGSQSRDPNCLKVHRHEILKFVFTLFWHHSIIDKTEVEN